jgi:hypothetical protein
VSIRGLEAGSSDLEHQPVVYEQDIARRIDYIPAEAAIARELVALGAEWAIVSDCFTGGRKFLQPDLVCVQPQGEFAVILQTLREATSRLALGGLLDVIAKLTDESIAFREAKYVTKKYRDVGGAEAGRHGCRSDETVARQGGRGDHRVGRTVAECSERTARLFTSIGTAIRRPEHRGVEALLRIVPG